MLTHSQSSCREYYFYISDSSIYIESDLRSELGLANYWVDLDS